MLFVFLIYWLHLLKKWGIKSKIVAGGIAPPTAAQFRKLLRTPLYITISVRIAKLYIAYGRYCPYSRRTSVVYSHFMSNRLFCAIPKTFDRIFAHAATKSMAKRLSLSQTRWSPSFRAWIWTKHCLDFFNRKINVKWNMSLNIVLV